MVCRQVEVAEEGVAGEEEEAKRDFLEKGKREESQVRL